MIAAVVIFILVFATASSGAIFSPGQWYDSLDKPSWTPPDWAFPVVWTLLYIMIAVSGWIVWRAEGAGPAMALWAAQLVFNAAWSWLFFGLRRMEWALADTVAMLACIVGYIVLVWPVSPLAALLFVPYGIWTCIAMALNFTVWRMNPAA